MNFAERYIYDQLNVREAGVLEFAGPCSGKNCKTCTHINEKIAELTQSSETKKPSKSGLAKAKQLRSLKKRHQRARTASNLRECPFCDGFHPITAAEFKPGDEYIRGLPRPSMSTQNGVSKKVIDENWPAKGMVHKRVPVPFAHEPGEDQPEFELHGPAPSDNPEGKDECKWCGGFITDPDEIISRWKENGESGRAFFHPQCLSQIRTFCSGARRAPEDTFETGPYSEIRKKQEEEEEDSRRDAAEFLEMFNNYTNKPQKGNPPRNASNLSINCLWCGGFHPRTAEKWTPENDRKIGLPRPFLYNQTGEFKRTPVPYSHTVEEAESEHPYDIYLPTGEIPEHRCMWCGEKFEQNEPTERWKGSTFGTGVDSQLFPMHPKCMRQLKIFCPHVRSEPDEAFESGPYIELRKNAEEATGLS